MRSILRTLCLGIPEIKREPVEVSTITDGQGSRSRRMGLKIADLETSLEQHADSIGT